MSLLHSILSRLTWPVTVTSLALGLLAVIFARRFLTPIRDIPGPFFASFSRLWHIYHIIKGDQNLRLVELHEQHGHFIRISHNEVSVSHPEAVQQILLASLHKAPWYKITAIPDYRFQTPFSTLDPKTKKERSRHFAPGYTTTNILLAESEMDRYFDGLKGWMDHFAKDQNPMHLDKFLSYATFDVAGEMLFSQPFGFLKAGYDLDNAISTNVALNLHVAIAGFYYWLHTILIGNPLMTKTGLLPMGHLYNTTIKALNKRLTDTTARFDMVAHWFKAQRNSPDLLSLRDVYAHVTNSVGAGSDTVSIGVQSFIYHLIRNPLALERIRSEIQDAQAAGQCQTSVISYADAQSLPFLQACVKESLRIFSPVGIGMPRIAGKDGVRIGDRVFSEGTIISINPWVLHYSKDFWGPDAADFVPERWLEKDIMLREKYFVPFGAGYGSCPGQNLAKVELSKLCATIARDYEIVQVDRNQKWKWKARVTTMQHSWPVYITKRI